MIDREFVEQCTDPNLVVDRDALDDFGLLAVGKMVDLSHWTAFLAVSFSQ